MSKLAHQEAPKTVSLVDYHVEDEPTKFKEVAKQQKVAYRCCVSYLIKLLDYFCTDMISSS